MEDMRTIRQMRDTITWHFHWKFWEPFTDCIGDPVRFGWWAEVTSWNLDGETYYTTKQDHNQMIVKRDMGLISY